MADATEDSGRSCGRGVVKGANRRTGWLLATVRVMRHFEGCAGRSHVGSGHIADDYEGAEPHRGRAQAGALP